MKGQISQTRWKVEGSNKRTKIAAYCPVCKTKGTIGGDDPMQVVLAKSKHNLCKRRVERIPTNIRDEYWQRAVVSQMGGVPLDGRAGGDCRDRGEVE
jgi:hypothetical protein